VTAPLDSSLLDLDPDTLDIMLGRAVLAGELKSAPPGDEESRSAGRAWFERNLAELRKAVCTSVHVRRLAFGPDKVERNMLFAAIVDTLATIGKFPVPLAVVSAQIMHYGLGKLCANLSGTAVDQ
jgi:hypothetical protein